MLLQRESYSDIDTIGRLTVDGVSTILWTLELPYKDGLPGSCIPEGTYPVVLVPSPKFQASTDPWVKRYASRIPRLLQIPNRTNILIHWGNSVTDTEGCILVGMVHPREDFIGSSRMAFELLWNALDATNGGSITVTSSMPAPIAA